MTKAQGKRVGEPERIQTPRAAEITGLSIRTIQHLACGGKIPGAAMLGGRWTFDPEQLRRWIKNQEEEACQNAHRLPVTRTSTKSETLGISRSRSAASKYVKAYEQRIKRKPASAATGA